MPALDITNLGFGPPPVTFDRSAGVASALILEGLLSAGRRLAGHAAARIGLGDRFSAGTLGTAQSRRLLGVLRIEGEARFRTLAGRLVNGEIGLIAWADSFRGGVGRLIAAGFYAIHRGRVLTTAAAIAFRVAVGRQWGFLNRFHGALATGAQLLDGTAVARAGLYGAAAWGAAVNGHRAAALRVRAYAEELRVLGTFDHCFPVGTMVETDGGSRPIESIQVGDRVLTRAGFRRVVDLFRSVSREPLLRIEAGGRSVYCTGGHPFLTRRGWVEAKNLVAERDTVFLQDATHHVEPHVALPDADHPIPAGGEVFIAGRVPPLLGNLTFRESSVTRVSVPPVAVAFDDQSVDFDVDHEIGLDDDMGFVGDAEGVKDRAGPQFQLAGLVPLEFSVAGEQFREHVLAARGSDAHPFGRAGATRRIIGPHVLGGLVVDDATRGLLGQPYLQPVGLADDLAVGLVNPLGDPCGAIVGVMGIEESDILRTPNSPPRRSRMAPDASLGIEIHLPVVAPGTLLRCIAHSGLVYHINVFNIKVEGLEEYVANGFLVHNCNDCLYETSLRWQPAGTLREIGDSVCRARCGCHFIFRTREGRVIVP